MVEKLRFLLNYIGRQKIAFNLHSTHKMIDKLLNIC